MNKRPVLRRVASVVAAAVLIGGCDLVLSPEQGDAPELRFQVETGADTTVLRLLGEVDRMRVTLSRDGVAVDTILPARATGGVVRARGVLSPPSGSGPLSVVAQAIIGSAVIFEGLGVVPTSPSPVTTLLMTPVAGLIIATPGQTLTSLGDRVQLTSRVSFATGDPIPGAIARWTSSDESVVSIGSGDMAEPHGNGHTMMTATFQAVRHSVTFTVRQLPSLLSGLAPADTTIAVGDSFTVAAFGEDLAGFPLLPGAEIDWQVEGGITIDTRGRVIAESAGPATVRAVLGETVQSATVTVVPPPG